MRTSTFILVPTLSLLNMGVQAATIANILTSRHPGGLRQDTVTRQLHNADFTTTTAPATLLPKRDIDLTSGLVTSSAAEPNGEILHITGARRGSSSLKFTRQTNTFVGIPVIAGGISSSDVSTTAAVERDVIVSSAALSPNADINEEIVHITGTRRGIDSLKIARQAEILRTLPVFSGFSSGAASGDSPETTDPTVAASSEPSESNMSSSDTVTPREIVINPGLDTTPSALINAPTPEIDDSNGAITVVPRGINSLKLARQVDLVADLPFGGVSASDASSNTVVRRQDILLDILPNLGNPLSTLPLPDAAGELPGLSARDSQEPCLEERQDLTITEGLTDASPTVDIAPTLDGVTFSAAKVARDGAITYTVTDDANPIINQKIPDLTTVTAFQKRHRLAADADSTVKDVSGASRIAKRQTNLAILESEFLNEINDDAE